MDGLSSFLNLFGGRLVAAVACQGRNSSASTTPATAIPTLTHSIASIPCANAERTWSSSAGDPSFCATARPANTLLRTALAVAAGSPASCSWDW